MLDYEKVNDSVKCDYHIYIYIYIYIYDRAIKSSRVNELDGWKVVWNNLLFLF